MRRVGNRQSATPSPAPGSVSGSMVGDQAMKRGGSAGSRVPSRLSTQAVGSPAAGGGDSAPGTPAKSRMSLPFRTASGAGGGVASQTRVASGTSRPLSRQSSKDADVQAYPTQSRRGSIQHQLARSPGQTRSVQPPSSDSEDEMTQSRITARRPNPSSIHRRVLSYRKEGQSQRGNASSPIDPNQAGIPPSDDEEEDDEPSFLPFANPPESKIRPSSSSQQDPSATLRGALNLQQGQTQARPNLNRRTTSERIISSPTVEPPTPVAPQRTRDPTSSASSLSSPTRQSAGTNTRPPRTEAPPPIQSQSQSQSQPNVARLETPNPNPLSPPHRALLQSSPRRQGPGSDTSPSMGSSFSDLDDASVTQSALEEALLAGMGNTTMTIGGRVSGISQALRSRYFDASHGQGRGGGAVSDR